MIVKAFLRETIYRKNMLILAFVSAFLFSFILLLIAQLLLPTDITLFLPKYKRCAYIYFYDQEENIDFYREISQMAQEGSVQYAYLFGKIEGAENLLVKVIYEEGEEEQLDSEAPLYFTIDPSKVPGSVWFQLDRYILTVNEHQVACKGLNKETSSESFPRKLIDLNAITKHQIIVSRDGGEAFYEGEEEAGMGYLCFPWRQYEALDLRMVYAEIVFRNEISEENLARIERTISPNTFEFLRNSANEALEEAVAASHESSNQSLPVAIIVFGFLMVNQLVFLKAWLEGYRRVARRVRLLGCGKGRVRSILFFLSAAAGLAAFALALSIFNPLKQWLISIGVFDRTNYSAALPSFIGYMAVFLAYVLTCIQLILKRGKGELL